MADIQWKNFSLFADREVITTEKSILLMFPKESKYKDYSFWFPLKLVRKSRSGKLISLSYYDDFELKIFKEKTENGRYIKEGEKTIKGSELYKEFEGMDSKIQAYKSHDAEEDTKDSIYAPKTNL